MRGLVRWLVIIASVAFILARATKHDTSTAIVTVVGWSLFTWVALFLSIRSVVYRIIHRVNKVPAMKIVAAPEPVLIIGAALLALSTSCCILLLSRLPELGVIQWITEFGASALGLWWIVGSFVGFILSWFGAFQLDLSDLRMEVSSLWTHHAIERSKIQKAEIGTGRVKDDIFSPPNRLEITTTGVSRPIVINLKLIPKSKLKLVWEWLSPFVKGNAKMPPTPTPRETRA